MSLNRCSQAWTQGNTVIHRLLLSREENSYCVMKINFGSGILGLLIAVCASCRTATCETVNTIATFSGFDSADLAYIIVEEYDRGTSFGEMVREYVTGTAVSTGNGEDTLKFTGYIPLQQSLDKLIRFPAMGLEYRIRDLSIDQKKRRDYLAFSEMDPCTNGASVYINDELQTDDGSDVTRRPNSFTIEK